MNLVTDQIKSMLTEYELTNKVSDGKTRPKMGATLVSMVICDCTFASPNEYNDHCSRIHGVTTRAHFRQAPAAPSAPVMNAPGGLTPNVSGSVHRAQDAYKGMIHLIKNISSQNDQYIPLTML